MIDQQSHDREGSDTKVMNPFYEVRDGAFFVGKVCDTPFPMHVHNVVECVHLFTGTLKMRSGGRNYQLTSGDTIIFFPQVSHSYEEISPDMSGVCMIFEPDAFSEFSGLFHTMTPVCPLLTADAHDEGLNDALKRLTAISRGDSKSLVKGYLHVCLSHLFTLLPLQEQSECMNVGMLQKVMQYLSQHYQENLTLEAVAHALGVSRSHLSHLFSAQLKVNFRRYLNTLRIDQACKLLRSTQMSITEISYQCGFNDTRTFHRAFLQEQRIPPMRYRETRQSFVETK